MLQDLPHDEIVGEITTEIERRLSHGKPHAGSVARACGMSERTMHRRLKERGLSYRSLVDKVRYALARDYLSSSVHLASLGQQQVFPTEMPSEESPRQAGRFSQFGCKSRQTGSFRGGAPTA